MNEVTKPAHTPGPWTLNVGEIWGPTEPKGHDGRLGRLVGFTDADARLIAAAPEMRNELEALKHDLEAADLDGWSPWKQHLGEIRALLARIDGTPNAS